MSTSRHKKNRNWGPFALLLIDVQGDFWDEVRPYFPNFPDHIRRLLRFCRTEGLAVIHLRSCFKADRSDAMPYYRMGQRTLPCIQGSGGVAPPSFALEQAGETVFVKQTFDGFLQPELDAYLKAQGKQFLLTAGLVTSICVFLTTAAAYQRGYLTALVEDCCADIPAPHQRLVNQYKGLCFSTTRVDTIPEQYYTWQRQLARLTQDRPRSLLSGPGRRKRLG